MWIINNLFKTVDSISVIENVFKNWHYDQSTGRGIFEIKALTSRSGLAFIENVTTKLGEPVVTFLVNDILHSTLKGDKWLYPANIQRVCGEMKVLVSKGAKCPFIERLFADREAWKAKNAGHKPKSDFWIYREAVKVFLEAGINKHVLSKIKAENFLVEFNLTKEEAMQLRLLYCLDWDNRTPHRKVRKVLFKDGTSFTSNRDSFEPVKLDVFDGKEFDPMTGDCSGSAFQGLVEYGYIPMPFVREAIEAEVAKIKEATEAKNKELAIKMSADDPDEAYEAEAEIGRNLKFIETLGDLRQFLTVLLQLLPHCRLHCNSNTLDSRLRNIIGEGSKVYSWYSWKALRACLKIVGKSVRPLDLDGLHYVCTYVADLFGMKRGNKFTIRLEAWKKIRHFAENPEKIWELDMPLHERIMLSRICFYFSNGGGDWDIPIEMDQTSEIMATTSTLLGWGKMMVQTGVANDTYIWTDGWYVKGHKRYIKHAVTPAGYGCAIMAKELAKRVVKMAGLKLTDKQFQKLEEEILDLFADDGPYAIVAYWAKYLVNGMKKRQDHENGHKANYVGYELQYPESKHYDRWTEANGCRVDNSVYDENALDLKVEPLQAGVATDQRRLSQTRKKAFIGWKCVPQGNPRFWPTALVHSLAAQITQWVMISLAQGNCWFLSIHDAFMTHPNDCWIVSKIVARGYAYLYRNRRQIVDSFLASISGGNALGLSFQGFLDSLPAKLRAELQQPEINDFTLLGGTNVKH